MSEQKIQIRVDGHMGGVRGPLFPILADRQTIAGMMGWEDGGEAVDVITKTMALLTEGKAVKLTSHDGFSVFQPLSDSEDGRTIPASARTIYNPDGQVIERVLS